MRRRGLRCGRQRYMRGWDCLQLQGCRWVREGWNNNFHKKKRLILLIFTLKIILKALLHSDSQTNSLCIILVWVRAPRYRKNTNKKSILFVFKNCQEPSSKPFYKLNLNLKISRRNLSSPRATKNEFPFSLVTAKPFLKAHLEVRNFKTFGKTHAVSMNMHVVLLPVPPSRTSLIYPLKNVGKHYLALTHYWVLI